MSSWQDIPLLYGQSTALSAVAAMLTAAGSSTQRIALFGDSRAHSPDAQGSVFVPRLNYLLNQTLGTGVAGESQVGFVKNYGPAGQEETKWLQYGRLSSTAATGNDTPLNRTAILPGMGRGGSQTGVLTHLSDGGGVLHVLTHNGLGIDAGAAVPTDRDYIGADQALVYDLFGVQQPGAPDVQATHLRQATPGSFTDVAQSIFPLHGLDATGGGNVVKISTPELVNADFAATPYSGIRLRIDGTDTGAYMIAGRWRRAADPGGFCATTFSIGGYTAGSLVANHPDAGQMLSVMGPWAASLIHFGVNDIYGLNQQASTWQTNIEAMIARIRSASWLNNANHLILLSTDSPVINGSPTEDEQHDLLGSAAKAIADNDPYVAVVNTRLGCETLGFTRATGEDFLADSSHPNAVGAGVVAEAMVSALQTQAASEPEAAVAGSSAILGNGIFGDAATPGGGLGALMTAITDTQSANLIAAYAADEDLATAKNNPGLADASGNNRTATHPQTENASWDSWFTFEDGPQNNIEAFITNSEARFGWNAALPSGLPTNWTMLAFVNNQTNAAGAVSFVDKDAGAAGRGVVTLRLFDSGALILDSFDDAGSRTILANSAGNTLNDQWVMVAATYDSGTPALYVDGVDVTPGGLNSLAGTHSESHMVGGAASQDPSENFISVLGSLGPYAFWSEALTGEQIAAIFTASGL